MGSALDDEIDALYQLPAGEFTAARNALAKRAGERAAEVRALAKPQAAAWAVNQVYWRRRPVFDALVKASETRRAAYVKQLHGDGAGVAAADAKHRAALDAACDVAVSTLREAGDALSPATLEAIRRTLEAVPSPDITGRLVRPIEPVGFSMLASLMTAGPGVSSRHPGDVVVMKRRDGTAKPDQGRASDHTPTKREREQAKKAAEAASRAAEALRREREQLTRELAAATSREREALDALGAARQAMETAGRRLDQLEKEAAAARRALAERRDDAERARRAVNEAAIARVRLERRLRELGE
jgi:hypothetical protein